MHSTMMQMPLTVNHILERGNQIFGNRQIISRRPDKSIHRTNYAALYRRSRQLAAALVAAGIKPGDRVATLMWNHAEHLEAYFGIPAAGGVLHTLNLRLPPADLAYIINDAEDRILLVDDVLLPLLEQVKPLVKIERVIVVPTSGATVADAYDNYEKFIDIDASDYEYPVLDENAACGMCYTSGTTGRPKGVVYSHRSTVLHALGISLPDFLNLSAMDTVLAVTPMFHANSWGVPYAGMMVGLNQVFPGQHMGAVDLLNLMESEHVTLAMGVPTIWLTIQQALEAEPNRWKLKKGMRMMVGGSAAPAAMIAAFEKFNLSIVHGWGMTELSPVGTLSFIKPEYQNLPVEEQYKIRALQGIPAPLVELRIMGEQGKLPWDGKSAGELQARGPWVTSGYYKTPANPDKITSDGWLRTGDIAAIDPAGYMRISDRMSDLIKSGGEWISSVDMENILMAHPAVLEAAVVAVKHAKWSERPLAVIVTKQGKNVTIEELRKHLAPHFAKWQIPDDWAFIDAIPRTSTGKFLKTKLRADFKDWISKTPG